MIAEGLTNVVRYAETRNAAVQRHAPGGEVVVVVTDDGIGGATVDGGTGLRGLIDRLAVLDGRLTLTSPLGEGTRLEAHIPFEPGSLVAEAGAPREIRRCADARAASCSRSPSPAAASTTEVREPDLVVRGDEAVAARPSPDHAGARAADRHRADRLRHPRPGVGPVLGDRQEGRRRRRAPDRRRRLLPRAGHVLDPAHAPAHRRGGRRPARRAGRLAARREGARGRRSGRRAGRDPGRHDQLRQRRVQQARRARPRRPARVRGRAARPASGWRAAGVRARAVRQPGGRQRGPRGSAAAGSPTALRKHGGTLARGPVAAAGRAGTRSAGSPQRDRRPATSTAS